MNGIIAIAVETSLLESLPLYSPLVLSCLKSLSCLKFTQQSSLCSSSLLGSSTNPAPVCRLPSLSMHPSCDCFSGGGEKKTGGEVDFSPNLMNVLGQETKTRHVWATSYISFPMAVPEVVAQPNQTLYIYINIQIEIHKHNVCLI